MKNENHGCSTLKKKAMKVGKLPLLMPGISGYPNWLICLLGWISGIFCKNTDYYATYVNTTAAQCSAYCSTLVARYEKLISPLKIENHTLAQDKETAAKMIRRNKRPERGDTFGTHIRRTYYFGKANTRLHNLQGAIDERIARNNTVIESLAKQVVQYQQRAVSRACAKAQCFLRGAAKVGVSVEHLDEKAVRGIIAGSFMAFTIAEGGKESE